MKPALKSLEALRLHLVENHNFTTVGEERQSVSLEDLIEYLIESVEESDPMSTAKVEGLLTRIGKPAIPYLIKGLKSGNANVKSVSAMVLIRIGQPIVDDLKAFYVRQANRNRIGWVVEFILSELGEQLPAVDEELDIQPVRRVAMPALAAV